VAAEAGPAAHLHAGSAALVSAAGPVDRQVRILSSADRAVVLGSAQPEDHLDRSRAAAAGLAVVRRPSGGGAVLVGPGLALWIDVVVPAGDALWDADVGRAAWWLGQVFVAALADVGLPGGEMWSGPMVRRPWSDRVCFAGVGAGEVTLSERKLVGIAQRRTRSGALFQCAVPIVWDPQPLLEVLRWPPGQQARAAADLGATAAGVGVERAAPLVAALVARLP
jgi:lipoate-protein ligase A